MLAYFMALRSALLYHEYSKGVEVVDCIHGLIFVSLVIYLYGKKKVCVVRALVKYNI